MRPSRAMLPLPGWYDGYGWAKASSTIEGRCGLWATGNALVTYSGIGTSELAVKWQLTAHAGSLCECTEQIPPNDPPCTSNYRYCARADADMVATVGFAVDSVPVGTPVLIYASWYNLINCAYDPENVVGPDDPASVNVNFIRVGVSDLVVPGLTYNNNPALLLLPPGGGSGVISALGGQIIKFEISADVLAGIEYDPQVCYGHRDRSEATVAGKILLSIGQPPSLTLTPPSAYPPGAGNFAEFSLDIGSDTEASDPNQDGDEVFDPGDMYPWNGPPLPVGGADGIRDDQLIFGFDYAPTVPFGLPPLPPPTPAPTCQPGLPLNNALIGAYFDLDGSDAIGADLAPFISSSGPLTVPILQSQFNIDCVYGPDNLIVSFDDDDQSHYVGTNNFCGTPVTSSAGFNSRPTFGKSSARDELSGIVVLAAPTLPPSAQVVGGYPALDEVGLHVSMTPDPDVTDDDDDDVDALDVPVSTCGWWYVSADHEATGSFGGPNLDPGSIYEVSPFGGAATRLIDPTIHLGLNPGTDIDAFEFVWLPYPSGVGNALALLFSVSPDDWLTHGVDETGGLDPKQIYGSFLDGVWFDYLGYVGTSGLFQPTPLSDDIDALAASPVPFVTQNCTVTTPIVFSEDFESYLAGQIIAGPNGWQAWPNPPGAAGTVVSPPSIGALSGQITPPDHLVREIQANSGGLWTVTFSVYVPSTSTGGGYVNLLNHYIASQSATLSLDYWSVRLRFDASNGTVLEELSGNSAPLIYDQWIQVRADIDLIGDHLDLYYNGALMHSGSWTLGRPSAYLDLAALELWGGGSISEMFVDNIAVQGNTDCNANGVADSCDISGGTSTDCDGNGIPDECERDCNNNSQADDCDIAFGLSLDCNGNGTPDACDIAAGYSYDCNSNGTPDECEPDCNTNGLADECDIAGGFSADCNGNNIPDDCEPDCNHDLVADSCDIAIGASNDCNTNGIPDECDNDCNTNGLADECDIAGGFSADCNSNNIPDECDGDCNGNGLADDCDIASGFSTDCNTNGTPDECEPDCNTNGVADQCDITSGFSVDCDSNIIPDECEPDCNTNGVADQCDITSGFSVDCNGNIVPDNCESPPYPDYNADGHVGSVDYTAFNACQTGVCTSPPCVPPLYTGTCCHIFDSDGDGDIDLADYRYFQSVYTGP